MVLTKIPFDCIPSNETRDDGPQEPKHLVTKIGVVVEELHISASWC